MGRNLSSEVGAGEDLLRAIVQMGAAEIHAMGLYFKTQAEMENGLINVEDNEVLQKQIEKAEMYREDIETFADLRRQMMSALMEMVGTDDANKDLWCMVKHLGLSAMQTFEAYENSDNNLALLNIAYDANKAFTRAVTRFLGVEITDCAACFAESMRGVERE